MGQDLAGKVAVVTGGANGLGRATVELFVEHGAKVVVADWAEAEGEALAARLGPAVAFRRTDVSKADDVQAVVDLAVERFGGLHVMFNNAGIGSGHHQRFADDDMEDFQQVLGVNLFGVMVGSQRAARHMARNGGGAIINTSSIAGVVAGYGVMAYRAAKAAVIHFSKSVAIDFAEDNIRVNCIAPGHIRTNLNAFSAPGVSAEKAAELAQAMNPVWDVNQPLKRRGLPRDVAEVALFLASERSAHMTGVVLPVEGGVVIGDPVNHMAAILETRARVLGS